jgi:hypothetical protein
MAGHEDLEDQMVIAFGVTAVAVILWLFLWLHPVLQGKMSLAQFVVVKLFALAQGVTYVAHAADQALVAYRTAAASDRSCPQSLWMEA